MAGAAEPGKAQRMEPLVTPPIQVVLVESRTTLFAARRAVNRATRQGITIISVDARRSDRSCPPVTRTVPLVSCTADRPSRSVDDEPAADLSTHA